MATPPSVFHAYLRPVMLQVLRATGYHSTRPNVLDSLTDLAARYMAVLCEKTASHAAHNHGDSGDFTVDDIRLALQDTGALLPSRVATEEMFTDEEEEDPRGVEEFIAWFSGQRMKQLMEVGNADGESEATDYLNGAYTCHRHALSTSHSLSHTPLFSPSLHSICTDVPSSQEETQQDGRRRKIHIDNPRPWHARPRSHSRRRPNGFHQRMDLGTNVKVSDQSHPIRCCFSSKFRP